MRIGIDLLWIRPGICGGTESYTRNMLDGFALYGAQHEFVLFVDGTHNAEEIQTVVSAFSNAMQNAAQKYDISGITFSAGVVSADARITNYKECYRRADKALYFAKQSGKNQVHVYVGR